jgi:hypothetical protein
MPADFSIATCSTRNNYRANFNAQMWVVSPVAVHEQCISGVALGALIRKKHCSRLHFGKMFALAWSLVSLMADGLQVLWLFAQELMS